MYTRTRNMRVTEICRFGNGNAFTGSVRVSRENVRKSLTHTRIYFVKSRRQVRREDERSTESSLAADSAFRGTRRRRRRSRRRRRVFISPRARNDRSLWKKRPRDVSFAGIYALPRRGWTRLTIRRRDAKYTCIDEINNTPYRYRYLFVRCLSIFFFNRLIIRRWYLLVCISFKHLRVLA